MIKQDNTQKIYDEHIIHQRPGFEATARLIGYVIEKMQQERLISQNVEVTGRIKSYASAYENSHKKILDDCFGIRIIGKDEDLKKIEEELEKFLVVDKTKDHRKKNTAYNAVHQMAHIKQEYTANSKLNYDLFPLVEIQYWNDELKTLCVEGALSYANYKKSAFKHIMDELQESPKLVFKELPTYYEVKGNRIRQLSASETLAKIYPEIDEFER